MKVLKRIQSIIRGKTEMTPDAREDPQQQLALLVNELNEQMQSLEKAVAAAFADERRLKMDIEDHLTQAQEWENRAMLVLEAGNEELAKEALLKKEEHETRSLSLQKAWKGQHRATERLTTSLQAAKQRISEAKCKYTPFVAQDTTTEKSENGHASFLAESPMALIDKLSDRIRKIEAEAAATMEGNGEGSDVDLEGRVAELAKAKKGTRALEALKAKLGEKPIHA